MRTASTTFKPSLEQLENRLQPSFLLGGNALQEMAAPLGKIVADMKTTASDLNNAVVTVQTTPNNSTAQARAHAVAISDLQRLLTEQAAVQAVSSGDVSFVRAAAMAELQSGDATDAIVLFYGKFIGLDPLKPLQDPADQANAIMQGKEVQGAINLMTNQFTFQGIRDIQYTQTPNF